MHCIRTKLLQVLLLSLLFLPTAFALTLHDLKGNEDIQVRQVATCAPTPPAIEAGVPDYGYQVLCMAFAHEGTEYVAFVDINDRSYIVDALVSYDSKTATVILEDPEKFEIDF